MTLVLDSGGLSALAVDRAFLETLLRSDPGVPLVPAVVLVEALTGDHRRDHAVNRLLRRCTVVPLVEVVARSAARLRTATGRASTISAADAVVAAQALSLVFPRVVTSDPEDLQRLSAASTRGFRVVAV